LQKLNRIIKNLFYHSWLNGERGKRGKRGRWGDGEMGRWGDRK
jgi:hypothetical protein